ncbi:MAG: DUF2637 domain-containing protein [Streptosporangiaceae bacterium]
MTTSARQPWARATVGITLATVAIITGITAAVSYEHEYQLARRHGQAPWVSSLLPFTVDGMILGASVVLVWAASVGIRRPWRPLAVLLAGIGATIGANLASGIGDGWLGAAVAAWSGLALILISDVAMWVTGTLRTLAAGDDPRPAAACSCPPPPMSLTEALPLAQARLKELGEASGQQALADRFLVTRHQVRAALVESSPAPAVAPSNRTHGAGAGAQDAAGTRTVPPRAPVPAATNGNEPERR